MSRYLPYQFTPDGRLRGSYVYLLLCADGDGPIYVKVGFSNNPQQRLYGLIRSCPVRPRLFAYVHVSTRQAALRLERDLLETFENWRIHGEWLKFLIEDKPLFNRLWKESFSRHAKKSWSLKWTQLPLDKLPALLTKKRNYYRFTAKKRGDGYMDAQKFYKS